MNKVILKGNVGRNPRIALTQDGRELMIFCLATHSTWKDPQGEWQTHTDWHRICVYRASSVRWLKDLLKQGDMVYVEGKLTYHQKLDASNQRLYIPYISIAGFEGRVEHIRHSRSQNITGPQEQSLAHVQEDCPFDEESDQWFPAYPSENPYLPTQKVSD